MNAQLSSKKSAEQATAREALLKLFTSVLFLARQGLALRGHVHEEYEGNLMQLFQLRSVDVSAIKR